MKLNVKLSVTSCERNTVVRELQGREQWRWQG
jgi:hypothetical protein